MLYNKKYSSLFDHNKDWITCVISDYDLARVQVGVFSLRDPISEEDDSTFLARDREEEEVPSWKIVCYRECLGSPPTTSVLLKTDNDNDNQRPQVNPHIY